MGSTLLKDSKISEKGIKCQDTIISINRTPISSFSMEKLENMDFDLDSISILFIDQNDTLLTFIKLK